MSKTNVGLVEYAKAQVGLPYWYGCYGQTASQSLYDSKRNTYPTMYTAKDYSSQYGKRVHDCSGLIKGYLWSDTATATPVYKFSQDRSAKQMYSEATEKGKIATVPDIEGVLVFKGTYASTISHVGVLSTDGYVYEAKGHSYGVVKTKFVTSDWNFWAKHKDIDYVSEVETTTQESETTETVTEVKATKAAQSFDESKAGTYKVTASELNMRNGAGKSYKILTTLPKNTEVQCYGYYTSVSNVPWLYVQVTYNKIKYTGFMSSSYLEKV